MTASDSRGEGGGEATRSCSRPTELPRWGPAALLVGSSLFAVYATLFPLLLPLADAKDDFGVAVRHPSWRWLAAAAFAGILCMLAGFQAVYARIQARSGWLGSVGYPLIQLAYLLQACRVSWELLVYPAMAGNAGSAFLLRGGTFWHDPWVSLFSRTSALVILAGVLLFGAAIFRSREFPKLAPACFVVGALAYAAGSMLSIYLAVAGVLVLTVGCFLLGRGLLDGNAGG